VITKSNRKLARVNSNNVTLSAPRVILINSRHYAPWKVLPFLNEKLDIFGIKILMHHLPLLLFDPR